MKSIRTVAGIGLVVLVAAGVAATRPASAVAGQPTADAARAAEINFPYPHLSVLRLTGDGQPDEARLIFDDGSITLGAQVTYQVPANGEPFQVASSDPQGGEPSCDEAEQICWGPTTVGTWLNTRVELTYVGVPCVITASPVDRTSIDCTDAG